MRDNLASTNFRIQSVDVLRGLVMVLMAIDHVRVYSGLPAGGAEAGIFFTRWITHFCAPAFVFFAGTSAYLYGIKIQNKSKQARYLITRGLLLIVLELTLIRFFWAFYISTDFILAGVIWMLGWCMILLAAFIWMKPYLTASIGTLVIVFQYLFSKIPLLFPETNRTSFGKFWEFIYPSGFETFPGVNVLYSLVPWIGVMTTGYGFGLVFQLEARKRNRFCMTFGITITLLFLIIAAIQIASSPPTDEVPYILQLLNQQKYPASTLFLMMTLGPIIALIPVAEKARNWFASALATIGKVPLFYYLSHILIIHLSALLVQLFLHGSVHHDWFLYAPYVYFDNAYRWSLLLLYLVFAIDVILLYVLCRWYARYKMMRPENDWLKYL